MLQKYLIIRTYTMEGFCGQLLIIVVVAFVVVDETMVIGPKL